MRKHESNQRIPGMVFLRCLITTLFVAVVLLTSVIRTEAASGTAEVSVTGTYNYEYAYEVLDQMNELRASVGVSSLVMDQTLLEYATQRAAEIAFLFEHTRPDGSSCFSIGSSVHGENIAYGYSTPTSVMNGWTNSSGHYANMVRSNFKSVGIGCFISPSGGIYWVQCFSYYSGTAASQPANGSKTVTVVISSDLASNLSIDRKSSMTIEPGQTIVSVKFGSMSLETTGWTFTSGDTSILTVSSSGVINALQEGATYVRATSTSNSTFYAEVSVTVEIPSYTVSFRSQGGSSVDSQTVKSGTEISDLPTPTKAGYTFDGWYTSSSGGTMVTSLTVSENVTLYAHWSVQTYTLSFDTQGGSSVSSQTVNVNATVYSLPTTTRSGYTFNGWYTSSSGGTRVTYVKVTADTTLYAQWMKTSSGTSTVSLGNCKITSLTNKASGIVVKWKQVDNASGYYVYRKVSGGSYTRIATITDVSTVRYEDTAVQNANGTVYKYKVLPYSGSSKGTGTAKTTVRLTGTSLTSVKNSAAGKAKVKWTAVTSVTSYQIQYSTSKTFASGNKTKKVSSATSVSKALSNLTVGKTYYVRIRTYKTVNGKTYYSAWSSKLKVKILK